MKTKLFRINPTFARKNKLPVYFVATQLRETNKAVYLFGRGTTETKKQDACSICGRALTHPVSVELGVGPECGKHYWDWDEVGGYTKENVERLTKVVQERIKIDSWLPRSVIYETHETEETVKPPMDHKMLVEDRTDKPSNREAKEITFEKSGDRGIKMTFPFDRNVINQIKTIPGRKYHSEGANKYWTAPISVEAVEKLELLDFEIDKSLLTFLNENKVNIEEFDANDIDVPGLGGELFPFQAKGIAFLEARKGRALIGDEMGLGKTVQALAWLQKHPKKRRAVIVCPASLKINWKREAERWMDSPNLQVIQGTSTDIELFGDIVIINYDVLQHWAKKLIGCDPQVIIFDEVHYIKNNKAKRTKAAKKIAGVFPHVIALTGTPIVNRPIEILNAIQLVDKSVAPNRRHFLHRYCGAKHNGFGWDFNGASNTKELHEKLTSTIMIRRKKKDVLKDLPDKIRSFVPMELDNEREYRQAENDFISFVRNQTEKDVKQKLQEQLGDMADMVSIDETKLKQMKDEKASKVNILSEIEGLKQLAVHGKMKQSVNWIRDYLETGEKLVVMAVHKFVINQLMEAFGGIAVKVDGSVTGQDRDTAVERFQNDDKIKLFVGNIQAAGVGLTLTAASTVAFLELPWTPGDVLQAEDRVHRIGQKESVSIYYLLAQDTIEEKIAALIDKKRKVLDSVLDGKDTEDESLLSEIMKSYQ